MPDQSIPRNTHLVLVAGTMNPSIHHPQWYKSLGAINDKELRESLKGGVGATTPIISRFQFGTPSFIVTCQPNLWMIQTADDSSWRRMLEISSLAFAKKENPTITAYGLMVQRHTDTKCDAKSFLATKVASLDLGFPAGKNANTNITLAHPGDGFTITTSIQTSVLGDHIVFGAYHYDYPTQEIESILDERFGKFLSDSSKFFADIVAAVNGGSEKEADRE
jgi:hypothetical protein